MGVDYNTKIVNDQLSLLLDVSNTKSYPGTGTSWYDLSANKLVFSALGTTPTPIETIDGVKSFAFNNSGYWECGTGYSAVDFGGDCTLIMWFRSEDTAQRRTIFEKAPTIYQSYSQEIAVTLETSEAISYYSRYNAAGPNFYDVGQTPAVNINVWTMIALKMSYAKTINLRTGFHSINGNNWSSAYGAYSTTPVTSAGAIRVGMGYAGGNLPVDNGNIAMVMCYNKMLNDEEIAQNFNALRGRFGI